MNNMFQGASDDQIALIGCMVALVGSAGLMYLSFFVGPASRKLNNRAGSENAIHKLPTRQPSDVSRDKAA